MRDSAIFLHSTGTFSSMYDATPVPSGFEKVQPTNLGYPPLSLINRPTAVTLKSDLDHLLSTLPTTGAVHLVAHSYGGLLALHLMPHFKDRVKSLFLYEPVLFKALSRSTTADPAAIAQANSISAEDSPLLNTDTGGSEDWLRAFIDYWNKPGSWDRMPEALKAATRQVGWKMFQEVRSVFFDVTNFADHRITAPVTLVKGARSPVAARSMIDELAKVNPHATVVDLQGTGHMAPLTHATLFADVVKAHWAKLGAS